MTSTNAGHSGDTPSAFSPFLVLLCWWKIFLKGAGGGGPMKLLVTSFCKCWLSGTEKSHLAPHQAASRACRLIKILKLRTKQHVGTLPNQPFREGGSPPAKTRNGHRLITERPSQHGGVSSSQPNFQTGPREQFRIYKDWDFLQCM